LLPGYGVSGVRPGDVPTLTLEPGSPVSTVLLQRRKGKRKKRRVAGSEKQQPSRKKNPGASAKRGRDLKSKEKEKKLEQ
jgi:hypothetical protein